MDSLSGSVALVTGGASGIGLATVRRLAAEGATVVVADVADEAGRAAAHEVAGRFVHLDVADPEAWTRAVDTVTADLGRLDVAHLNAGGTTGEPDVTALSDAAYRRVMGANVDGVVFGTRAVVPAMVAGGGGAIVVTASLAGLIAFAPDPVYTLTKHAVVGFVRSVAPQLQAKGVTINAICPGIVDTPLVGRARAAIEAAGFPMIDPSDIAAAVVDRLLGAETGGCWACQPGRPPECFEFGDVPGPRIPGAEGRRPPAVGRL